MEIDVVDNSALVQEVFHAACLRALERCGLVGEGYAKDLAPVDTGRLRNGISHAVSEDEMAAYVGSNTSYAPYVELATGIYADGGRPTPWVYQDDAGNWHWTRGNPAQPFLAPAVKNHAQTYSNIIKDELENA